MKELCKWLTENNIQWCYVDKHIIVLDNQGVIGKHGSDFRYKNINGITSIVQATREELKNILFNMKDSIKGD